MSTAEKLVQARGEKTREAVAKAVGVSISAIAMYETGARIPRDEIKIRLADHYGVSVQALFYDRDVTSSDATRPARSGR